MKKICPNTKERGNTAIIVIFVVMIIAIATFLLVREKNSKVVAALPTLPPVSDRTNPTPTSGYAISVGTVNPGNSVTVDSVELAEDATISVVLDSAHPQTLGKSSILKAGTHTSISIKLSPAIKDGDVIVISLLDANGKAILNADKQKVEVTKNVGHLMTHYSTEY
jgi:hypothetical protein